MRARPSACERCTSAGLRTAVVTNKQERFATGLLERAGT